MRANRRGAILLYVLFLSSFLIIFFASFDDAFRSMLSHVEDSSNSMAETSALSDALVSLKGAPEAYRSLWTKGNLQLRSVAYDGSSFSGSLPVHDTHEYWITSSGGAPHLSLSVSAPVFYRLAVFQSGSENSATVYASGLVVSGSDSIPLPSSLDRGILALEWLGGNSHYSLSRNGAALYPASDLYVLWRTIAGYRHSEGIHEVVNFTPKSYSGIDYTSLECI